MAPGLWLIFAVRCQLNWLDMFVVLCPTVKLRVVIDDMMLQRLGGGSRVATDMRVASDRPPESMHQHRSIPDQEMREGIQICCGPQSKIKQSR